MDQVIWHLRSSGGFGLFSALWVPLMAGMVLYYSGYLPVFVRAFVRKARPAKVTPEVIDPPEALIVLPTLLGNRDALDGLQRAITSVVENGYPGKLVVVAAIDHADGAPHLVRELERWVAHVPDDPRIALLIASTPQRTGKSMAIEAGIEKVREVRGELPPVFFNMDADSELGAHALVRMVAALTTPGRIWRRRPMIVASNVVVRKDHYWTGWRGFFTIKGQLSLQVAREYLTSISLSRNNWRILPVTSVSGALYCCWTDLYTQGPKFAGFLGTFGVRAWLKWWIGGGAPSLARSTAAPNPAAMIGPSDDTFVAWLALCARWDRGAVSLELPPTPFHAFARMVASFFVRPIAYDPDARVFTATPSTIRGLFKQRVRWNTSRVWLMHRFGPAPWFFWSMGLPVYLDVGIVLMLHGTILVGLLIWPFVDRPSQWLAVMLIAGLISGVIRALATLLAMLQDDDLRGQWQKLLALPLSGPYHFVFNILTTVVGLVQDVLLFGVNTGFAPESTLIACGTGRIAVAYRLRRAFGLAARAAWCGDVPFGWWWFGWERTRYTRNGYEGWTDRLAPTRARRRSWSRRRAG